MQGNSLKYKSYAESSSYTEGKDIDQVQTTESFSSSFYMLLLIVFILGSLFLILQIIVILKKKGAFDIRNTRSQLIFFK